MNFQIFAKKSNTYARKMYSRGFEQYGRKMIAECSFCELYIQFSIDCPIFPWRLPANCEMSKCPAFFFSASSSSSLPLGPCNYSDYLAQTYRQDTNHSGSSNNNAKSHAAPLTQCQVTSVSESLSPVPLLHPWPFRPDFLHPARLRLWPFDQRRHTAKEMRRSK